MMVQIINRLQNLLKMICIRFCSFPPWTSDGQFLVFQTTRHGSKADIYVIRADGSEQTRLTSDRAGYYTPTIAPDSHYLAIASRRDGNWEIYMMHADTSLQTRLTNHAAADTSPVWQP